MNETFLKYSYEEGLKRQMKPKKGFYSNKATPKLTVKDFTRLYNLMTKTKKKVN